jgi:hypothetical protein
MKIDYIKEQLTPFCLSYYRFSYIAEEEVRFNAYKGAVFRGGLGHVLRDKVCLLPGVQCKNCHLSSGCIYIRLFESPVPAGSKHFAGQPFAPHPFVIEPPLEKKNIYRPGEVIDFRLVLIGAAVHYLPYFIYAFIELGNKGIGMLINGTRGKCTLNRVESLGSINGEALSTLYLKDHASYTEPSALLGLHALINNSAGFKDHCQFVKVKFATPTSIKVLGQLTAEIDFCVFIKNVLRRITTLSYFYCNHDLDLDYALLLDQAASVTVTDRKLQWVTWDRFSGRQQQRFLAEGFQGEITFQGDLELFLPLILFGQYLHLGKSTSFGYGKYILC